MSQVRKCQECKEEVCICCKLCKKFICICHEFICPYHGKTKAILTEKTKEVTVKIDPKTKKEEKKSVPVYKCSAENCAVERLISEMEFPKKESDKSG